VLVIFAGSVVVLCLVAALVFDLGMSWMLRRQEQNVVDPGALAAAQYIPSLAGPGATPAMVEAACFYARQSGFFSGATTNDGCLPANDPNQAILTVNYPPVGAQAGAFEGRLGFVQVAISRQHPNFFLGIIGQPTSTVAASAIAADTTGDSNSYSLIALDTGCTNGSGQLGGTGGSSSTTTAKVSIVPAIDSSGKPYNGGYVQVNSLSNCSNDPAAPTTTTCLDSGTAGLQVAGGSGISAPAIFVSGTCANSGTITTNAGNGIVTQGALQVGDPLAELVPPDPTTYPTPTCGASGTATDPVSASGCKFNAAGTYQMQPGVYYGGWSIGNNVTLELASGTYIMAGGGIKLNAGGSITSVVGTSGPAPVMIFSTDDPTYHTACVASPGGTGCQGSIDLTANSTLDVTGLTSGQYAGLVVWQDGRPQTASCVQPTANCNVTLGGQTTLNIAGTIYAPKVQVTLAGGGTVSQPANAAIQIISWRWQITGGSTLTMPYDPNQLYHLEQRGLVH